MVVVVVVVIVVEGEKGMAEPPMLLLGTMVAQRMAGRRVTREIKVRRVLLIKEVVVVSVVVEVTTLANIEEELGVDFHHQSVTTMTKMRLKFQWKS